jgi:hypothetical protein
VTLLGDITKLLVGQVQCKRQPKPGTKDYGNPNLSKLGGTCQTSNPWGIVRSVDTMAMAPTQGAASLDRPPTSRMTFLNMRLARGLVSASCLFSRCNNPFKAGC